VRRDLFGAARALVVPTVALIGIAIVAPGRLELAVRIYALILCSAAIVLLLLALRRAYPDESPLRETARPPSTRTPPPTLARLEHEVALGVAGSFDLHFRLVPRLRALASGLLSSRSKVSLTSTPEAARALLGPEAWELVRPDREVPRERLGKGIPPPELTHVVDALEAI
jgi:hypothetical protein